MDKVKNPRSKSLLSNIIMPNIGIFIALGLVEALFSPVGWIPNERLSLLIRPMTSLVLPIVVGGAGGKIIGGDRGGIVAIIATVGIIVSSDMNMLIGAIIIGPISGWVMKNIDRVIEKKTPMGFEMIINNFVIAIIGIIMAILGMYFIGPAILVLTKAMTIGVNIIIEKGLLPLSAIFIEPAKVLFLNNTINHGILSPLGIEQARESGRSILFLLESNPGVGLGILLASYFNCKNESKKMVLGASVITFLGGIHEIYFPYILKRPVLILAAIGGSMASIFVATLLNVGLVSAASPGSIFTLVALSPKDTILNTIIVVIIAIIVSFILAMLLFKFYYRKKDVLNERLSGENIKESKEYEDEVFKELKYKDINKIVFSCDTGIGSSAMGATSFKNRIKNLNMDISITNSPVDRIPGDADVVVSHIKLMDRCKASSPQAIHLFIDNFLEDINLDKLYLILEEKSLNNDEIYYLEEDCIDCMEDDDYILKEDNILLNLESESKEEAIARAGRLLMEQGYITEKYIESMQEREEVYSTYIGMGVAIPHGLNRGEDNIKKSGIVILQYPNGVKFEENTAFLIIGVAAMEDEHMDILSDIAISLSDDALVSKFNKISNKKELIEVFRIE